MPDTDLDAALLKRAQLLADEELFPAANDTDRSGEVPNALLDSVSRAGLHGASIDARPETVTRLIEIMAGGCLTTAFIWTQHLGASAAAHACHGPAGRFADDMRAGRLRGGVAFAHMLRPGPPLTNATAVDDGWRFDGTAPWVTGWGHIDLLHAAARHGDEIVWALIDAADGPTMRRSVPPLATVHSSLTVVIEFDDHPVPQDRVTKVENYAEWRSRYALGLRNNGSLPLGVAGRCIRLLPAGQRPAFEARLDLIRAALDEASTDELPAARARAALFAVNSSTALVCATGGRAVMLGDHAQRLHREAMFLLVQGQTPAIKDHMLNHLASQAQD